MNRFTRLPATMTMELQVKSLNVQTISHSHVAVLGTECFKTETN